MVRFSQRIRVVGTTIAALAIVVVMAAPVAAVRPSPTFTAEITTDGACSFTLKGTWSGSARVATVYGLWFLDDSHLFTTQAPSSGPNGGTIKGRVATMPVGPLADTGTPHAIRAITQFYDAAGAQLASINSNVLTTNCGVAAP